MAADDEGFSVSKVWTGESGDRFRLQVGDGRSVLTAWSEDHLERDDSDDYSDTIVLTLAEVQQLAEAATSLLKLYQVHADESASSPPLT